jgi:hypothetical protein
MQQNFSTYNYLEHVFDAQSVPGSPTTLTSNPIDCKGREIGAVCLNVGAMVAGGTIDGHIEESADGVTSWSPVALAVFPQILAASGASKTYVGGLLLRNRLRFLRVVLTVTTSAALLSADFFKSYGKERPATPTETVAFEV